MRILITGVSTRAIAESACAAGYDVITLDYFGDSDQKRLCPNYSLKRDFGLPFSPGQLYRASQSLEFDAVVYISNLENYPDIVERLTAGVRRGRRKQLLGNSPAVLARVRHWPTVSGFLRQQGVPTPETIYPGQPLPSGRGGEGRWLRKPIRSGGGHRITFWPPHRRPGKGYLLQEYVPGLAGSASFVANGRECVVLGITEQLIGTPEFGARGFHYCGNILPLVPPSLPSPLTGEGGEEGDAPPTPPLPHTEGRALSPHSNPPQHGEGEGEDVLAQVRRISAALTREFGLVGVNGFDFVLNAGRVIPLEVNPRYSASMELIERACGLSIFDMHVRAITGGELPEVGLGLRLAEAGLPQTNTGFYGKAILYAGKDGRAPDTTGWLERGIRDVPFPGEGLRQGGPICTLLASAPTRDACFASLVAQAKALIGEIYA